MFTLAHADDTTDLPVKGVAVFNGAGVKIPTTPRPSFLTPRPDNSREPAPVITSGLTPPQTAVGGFSEAVRASNGGNMTADILTAMMRDYNQSVAPGSECNAWQDYWADFCETYGNSPASHPDVVVSDNFRDYWVDVTNGVSDEYHADTGGRTF